MLYYIRIVHLYARKVEISIIITNIILFEYFIQYSSELTKFLHLSHKILDISILLETLTLYFLN